MHTSDFREQVGFVKYGILIVITSEQQYYWISMNIWKKFEIQKRARPLFS